MSMEMLDFSINVGQKYLKISLDLEYKQRIIHF